MGKISNTVLTSRDQGLTKDQQKNARDNIGAIGRLATWHKGNIVVSSEGGEVEDSGVHLDPSGHIFVQSDWNESDPESPAYIVNKPDLSQKADKNYVDAGLATVNARLSTKAEKNYVDGKLETKAEKTYVDEKVAPKADKTYVDEKVAPKADKTYVDEKVASKAEKSYVDEKVAVKADTTYVDTGLAAKADTTYVDTELAVKADTTYVDTGLAAKADTTYVDTELGKKATTIYVDTGLAAKADTTYVDTGLAGKVDKVSGKGLSTNDYTDADQTKLAGIGNYPAESGGSQDTLVTTGDKYAWNNKQDQIAYYLADATILGDNSALVITKSDGTVLTFSGGGGGGGGSSTFDTITAAGTLLVPVNRNVNIPLATSTTTGQEGSAGLVKGIYEEFQT